MSCCIVCNKPGHAFMGCKDPIKAALLENKKREVLSKNTDRELRAWLQKETLPSLLMICQSWNGQVRERNKDAYVEEIVRLRVAHAYEDRAPSQQAELEYEIVEQEAEEEAEAEEEDLPLAEEPDEEEAQEEEAQDNAVADEVLIHEILQEDVNRRTSRSGRVINPLPRYVAQPLPRYVAQPPRVPSARATTLRPLKAAPKRASTAIRIYYRANKAGHFSDSCPVCLEQPPYIMTQCGHAFCNCILKISSKKARAGEDPVCPCCRTPVKRLRFVNPAHFGTLRSVADSLEPHFAIS